MSSHGMLAIKVYNNSLPKVNRRSKSGCFTCRRRKKKCDESHPACESCLRSGLECVWPETGNASLSKAHEFKIVKSARSIKFHMVQIDGKTGGKPQPDVQAEPNTETQLDPSEAAQPEPQNFRTPGTPPDTPPETLDTAEAENLFTSVAHLSAGSAESPRTSWPDAPLDDTLETPLDSAAPPLAAPRPTVPHRTAPLDSPLGGSTATIFTGVFSPPGELADTTGRPGMPDTLAVPSPLSLWPSRPAQMGDPFSFTENSFGSASPLFGSEPEWPEESSDFSEHSELPDSSDLSCGDTQEKSRLLGNSDKKAIWNIIYSSTALTGYNSWIPGVQLDRLSALFYHSYVRGFLPAMSPYSFSPAVLLPTQVFVPLSAESSMLRQIFLSCGASFLAEVNPEYRGIAERQNNLSIKAIYERLHGALTDGREIDGSLLVAVQLLALKEKVFSASCMRAVLHLSTVFNYLTQRLRRQRVASIKCQIIQELQYNRADRTHYPHYSLWISQEIVPDGPEIEELGEEIPGGSEPCGPLRITPTERTLIDSFIHNYTVSLITCKDLDIFHLPSPFSVFEIYKRYVVSVHDHKHPVEWVNNAVVGGAFEGYELAAKASWLARLKPPLHPHWYQAAWDLCQRAENYEPPELSSSALREFTPASRQSIQNCRQCGYCLAQASRILLKKIINPTLTAEDPEVQEAVEIIYLRTQKVPENSSAGVCLYWPIIIGGSGALNAEHRAGFSARCHHVHRLVHAANKEQIDRYFGRAWGDAEHQAMGIDVLLNRDVMENVLDIIM